MGRGCPWEARVGSNGTEMLITFPKCFVLRNREELCKFRKNSRYQRSSTDIPVGSGRSLSELGSKKVHHYKPMRGRPISRTTTHRKSGKSQNAQRGGICDIPEGSILFVGECKSGAGSRHCFAAQGAGRRKTQHSVPWKRARWRETPFRQRDGDLLCFGRCGARAGVKERILC